MYNDKGSDSLDYLIMSRDAYLQKSCDWKYEEEERLLIPDYGKEHAKIRYNFSALNSITFGMNTSYEDRYKVIDIIRRKCKENRRNNFEFYLFNPYDKEWDKKTFFSI